MTPTTAQIRYWLHTAGWSYSWLVILAAETARFGQPEIMIGILPAAGANPKTASIYRWVKSQGYGAYRTHLPRTSV